MSEEVMHQDNMFRGMLLPALVIWLLVIFALGHGLQKNNQQLTPPALDARLIELPPASNTPAPARMASPAPSKMPAHKTPVQPTKIQPAKIQPTKTQAEKILPPAPPKVPVQSTPPAVSAPAQPTQHSLPTPNTSSAAPATQKSATPPTNNTNNTNNTDNASGDTENMGAQAVYHPNPVIPEELRDDALHVTVSVRFHIAADGSVTVELTHPAPDPRLNRIVLDTLKTWRFFPATNKGKPITSTQDLDINIGGE